MTEVKRVAIEITTDNVFDLARAMDEAIKAESEWVEFEGEKIPTPVVGEALTQIAASLIGELIVRKISPPTDIERKAPEGVSVH